MPRYITLRNRRVPGHPHSVLELRLGKSCVRGVMRRRSKSAKMIRVDTCFLFAPMMDVMAFGNRAESDFVSDSVNLSALARPLNPTVAIPVFAPDAKPARCAVAAILDCIV